LDFEKYVYKEPEVPKDTKDVKVIRL